MARKAAVHPFRLVDGMIRYENGSNTTKPSVLILSARDDHDGRYLETELSSAELRAWSEAFKEWADRIDYHTEQDLIYKANMKARQDADHAAQPE